VTDDCPIAASDGHDFPRLVDQRVPGEAAVIDDIVEGFEERNTRSIESVAVLTVSRLLFSAAAIKKSSAAMAQLAMPNCRTVVRHAVLDAATR
jgi:hypothetical protein